MKGFRSFVAGLLLVPVLAFASPFTADSDAPDAPGLSTEKNEGYICYIFFMGRWIAIPC